MSRPLEILSLGAARILGRPLATYELQSFDIYLNILQKWQRVQRLVSSADPTWVVENLFLDSLLFLKFLPVSISAIADLGSGAGFPGVPIKIVRPSLEVVLIESRRRRVSFLSAVIRELRLERTQVVAERAENLPQSMMRAFGAVVVRCAGDPNDVLPVAAMLTSPGGIVVCSGPPERRFLRTGEWFEVPGVRPGNTRLFAVVNT